MRNTSSLLVFGRSESATAARVTDTTGLVPTWAAEAGAISERGRPQPHSRWDLSVESDPEDESGFGSLRILLLVVLPEVEALRSLRGAYEMRLSWGGFSDSSQGGFVLEPDIAQGVAELGLPIYGTAYLG